jgi:hypothetical protein
MLPAPARTWTAADLIFDPVTHTSVAPDGRDVPHVTRILSAVGVSTDFEGLAAQSSQLAITIGDRRELGSVVHLDTHAFDDEDLVWDSVDPRSRPFVESWATFRENTGLTPLHRERGVFHPGQWYCGFLDGVFRHPNGKRILPDLKIGDPEDAACVYQTSAYEAAWLVEHPDEPIDERWAVQLCPGMRVPYRITNYSARPDAWMDFRKFQAFMVTYWQQAVRRRRLS